MSDKKITWLYDLINFGGAVTGIILTAIGGTMLLNSALKLYVFEFSSNEYSYVTKDSCRFDYNYAPVPVAVAKEPTLNAETKRERTDEEIEKCMAERQAEERKNYTRRKQENMVDGLAMLIIGIPFWAIFDRRRRKSVKKK